MNIKVWSIIGVVLFFLLGMLYTYSIYKENEYLKVEKNILVQNELALKDSLDKLQDSLYVATSFIRNLQNERNKLDEKYIILKSKYNILISSVRDSGVGNSILEDSTGIVSFGGDRDIVTYTGRTTFNFNTKKSTYLIDLNFKPINIESKLFIDNDNIWKIKTYTLNSGIKLSGISVVDDDVFRKLKETLTLTELKNKIFGVGGSINYSEVYLGTRFNKNDWECGVEYKIFDKFEFNEPWHEKISISLYYFLF